MEINEAEFRERLTALLKADDTERLNTQTFRERVIECLGGEDITRLNTQKYRREVLELLAAFDPGGDPDPPDPPGPPVPPEPPTPVEDGETVWLINTHGGHGWRFPLKWDGGSGVSELYDLTIDWGDGTEPQALTGNAKQTGMYNNNGQQTGVYHEFPELDHDYWIRVRGTAEIYTDNISDNYVSAIGYMIYNDDGYIGSDDYTSIEWRLKLKAVYGMFTSHTSWPHGMTNYWEQAFTGCLSLVYAPDFDFGGMMLQPHMFAEAFLNCIHLKKPPSVDGYDTTVIPEGCFYRMFVSCLSITEVMHVPHEIQMIQRSAFSEMYSRCSSLEMNGYTLPAGICEVDSFSSMFAYSGVHDVATWGEDTVPGHRCFAEMYAGCKNLTTVNLDWNFSTSQPVENSYHLFRYMFVESSVTSVKIVFDFTMVSSTMIESFANMFTYCSSLEEVQINMLNYDKSLTEGTFYNMFLYCSSLKSIHLMGVDSWDNSQGDANFTDWVRDVWPGEGTFYKSNALPAVFSNDNIPVGWKVTSS